MTLSIGKKIASGFALALAALLAIGLTLYFDLRELNSASGWVTHTIKVEDDLQGLLSGLLQMESSARGYNLVPDAGFKDRMKAARTEIGTHYRSLQTRTQDNPAQQERLNS